MTRITSPASPALRPAGTRQAGLWQAVLILAASCMPVLGGVLITPVLPQMSEHFADQPGALVLVPLIATIPSLMIALTSPFVGGIVDRFGRKRLLIAAMFAYSVMGIAPVLLDNLGLILGSRLLLGACEAVIITVSTTLIVDYFRDPQRRNRYLGLQGVFAAVAGTVFVALAGALGSTGWHLPFWVYLLGAIIAVPMLFSLWEPARAEADDVPAAAPRMPIPWRRIAGPLVVTVFGGMTFITLTVQLSYLVVGTGIAATDGAVIGGLSAAAAGCIAIGGISFPWLIRMGHKRLIPLAFALQAVGMILIWTMPGLLWVTIGACIASLGSGLIPPSLLTWVVAPTAFAVRGRVTGWWIGSQCIGQFFSPLLVGGLVASTGSLPPAIGGMGIVAGLVAIVVFVALRRSSSAPAAAELDEARVAHR